MEGRTTFVIAHRLSTIVDADRVIFIEKGKVTGSGTHQKLIETHDLYRGFAEQQLTKIIKHPNKRFGCFYLDYFYNIKVKLNDN